LMFSSQCIETMLQYDDVDEDVLRNYHEFSLANIIFYGLKESACSEQSARMTAMDNATKNAGTLCFVFVPLSLVWLLSALCNHAPFILCVPIRIHCLCFSE